MVEERKARAALLTEARDFSTQLPVLGYAGGLNSGKELSMQGFSFKWGGK